MQDIITVSIQQFIHQAEILGVCAMGMVCVCLFFVSRGEALR